MAPQPRVLMVEDHPDIADLYQLKLQLDGYRVAVASDGAAGLRLARSLMPDLILLDIHVPQVDGLQILAALRDDKATDAVPVIVCSEDDDPRLMTEARRLGAAVYLIKADLLPSRLSRMVSDVLAHPVALAVDAGRTGARQAS